MIQNAINYVSGLPDVDGYKGAVLLKAGNYFVKRSLLISSSGVIIRGEGSGEKGTVITFRPNKYELNNRSLLQILSTNYQKPLYHKRQQKITDKYVPVGQKHFTVVDASDFKLYQKIMIVYKMNDMWLKDISNMGEEQNWLKERYQLKFRRTIVKIDPVTNLIHIDVPIVQAIDSKYGGGVIKRIIKYNSEITNIGVEGLRLVSDYNANERDPFSSVGISAMGLKNGWVRQVTGLKFGYSLVELDTCYQVTVEDCSMIHEKSKAVSGTRYSFNIQDAERILVQRCVTRNDRHGFVAGSKVSGPNVFVDCLALDAVSDIGPHGRYSTGQLYDNVKGRELNVQNRNNTAEQGWSGAQIMFWNCETTLAMVCNTPNGAMNWAVGNLGIRKKDNKRHENHRAPSESFGSWSSHNAPVKPRSLYYTQLAERLGDNALQNVALPKQIYEGRIWKELEHWIGNGVFLDPLVITLDRMDILQPRIPVVIKGLVRRLQILENIFDISWSQLSGHGTVVFGNSSMIETTATFTEPGTYSIQLLISNTDYTEVATLSVGVGCEDKIGDFLLKDGIRSISCDKVFEKRLGWCNAPLVEKNCPATCKACPICVDSLKQVWMGKSNKDQYCSFVYMNQDVCELYHWVKARCPVSCDACEDQKSDIPINKKVGFLTCEFLNLPKNKGFCTWSRIRKSCPIACLPSSRPTSYPTAIHSTAPSTLQSIVPSSKRSSISIAIPSNLPSVVFNQSLIPSN